MTKAANAIYHAKYAQPTPGTMPDPQITVYFLQASRSIRTVWLLELLQLPYALEFADRTNQKAPPEFKQRCGNPLGKLPSIRDGDLVVYESGAITEYLCERYDTSQRLIPSRENWYLRSKVLMFVHAAEATVALHALAILYARWQFPEDLKRERPEVLEEMEERMAGNVKHDLDWLEGELGRSTGRFLVGDSVTAADVMMQFSVSFILERSLGTRGGSWPRLREWMERCEGNESYERAVERSGHSLYPKNT